MSKIRVARLCTTFRSVSFKESLPLFLSLMLASPDQSVIQQSHFSTSSPSRERRKRDGNPNRGISALRRTGLRYPVGMSKEPLPQPVLDPNKRSKIKVDENHGLWGFFNKNRTALSTPEEDNSHGIHHLSAACYVLIRMYPRASMVG